MSAPILAVPCPVVAERGSVLFLERAEARLLTAAVGVAPRRDSLNVALDCCN